MGSSSMQILFLSLLLTLKATGFLTNKSVPRIACFLKESRFDEPQKEFIEPKSGLRPLDPSDLEIIAGCERKNGLVGGDDLCNVNSEIGKKQSTIFPFVNMIRVAGNYIANHRNTLSVLHIPGHLLEWDGFASLMEDIALTWLLGMKIVIVVGKFIIIVYLLY